MKKSAVVICVLVIALVTLLMKLRQTQTTLHQQIDSLRTQLESSQTDNASLSNSLAQAQTPQSSPDQSRELARLRNQVGMLRQQTNELDKALKQTYRNQPATDTAPNQAKTVSPEDFQLDQENRMSALRQLILAMYAFTNSKNDRFATNFDQLKDALDSSTNFEGGVTLDSFEFMNTGLTRISTPDLLIFREKTPRQSPDGKWVRIYGFADGRVQVRGSSDGNFDDYEKQHSPTPPQ